MLSNIRIVLVNTSHPGNIGAAARAMKVMNLQQLDLVAPLDYPSAEATARAAGADDILQRARVFDTLDQAIADCGLVMATSARSRALPWPELDPRQAAATVVQEAPQHPVAVVFGCEKSGLSNEQLSRANFHVHIPTNHSYSSLNLAQAVQVLAYEINMASQQAEQAPTAQEAVAGAEQLELFYQHLERVMVNHGFMNPDNPKQLMHRLRRLFTRARPEQLEMNILRGILTAVEGTDNE